MRPVTILCALFAGTATRLIFSFLPPFRRRRLRPSAPTPLHPILTPPPTVAAQLDRRAPPIRGNHYRRSNPSALPAECTFCLETIRPTKHETLRQTPCNHLFHSACLERWVFYTASVCLDWTQYSLSDDGSIVAHARPPTCPNCTTDLDVLPQHLVQKVVLTSIARSLSLRDLAAAAEVYDAGLVFRAPRPPPQPPITPSSTPTRQEPVRILPQAAARVDTARAVVTRSAFERRRDSTVSEPSLPPAAFVSREEFGLPLVRRSEDITLLASVVTGVGRGIGLSRRRQGGRRWSAEVMETHIVLQAIS